MANRFDYRGGEHETWLASLQEPVLEPALPIIDAHHHLWIRGDAPYLLREYAADLNSGHRVVASVFAECHSMYRLAGPPAMAPVGEMEFVAGIAAMSDSGAFGTTGVCRAAVGGIDFELGDGVTPVLEAMSAASGGRMRGVRASVCWDRSDRLHRAAPRAGFLGEPAVRAGCAALTRLGLSLDCWLYHTQLPELVAVADAFPDLTVIVDHTGTPILGGPYREQVAEVRAAWLAGMTELARRDNVFVKLGALPARFDAGDGSHPPDSTAVAAAWAPWIEPCIERFGAHRCMFESNFPVHKNWLSFQVLWNAFKRIAAGASASERSALFAATAAQVYKLTDIPTSAA
jgi:predicted TIM-barrel fold metal-dependent hydrolase